jgi:hypothetical protein
VPGSGTPAEQVHDFNGGILASGLFWTLPAGDWSLRVSRDGRRAVLRVRELEVIDAFQFLGPYQTPARVSFDIEWQATGPFEPHGAGTGVPATDPAAFRGAIARARSGASFEGEELGFAFSSGDASTDRTYAQVGFTRNGVFL